MRTNGRAGGGVSTVHTRSLPVCMVFRVAY